MLLFLMKIMYCESFFELPRLVNFFRLRKYQKRRPHFRPYEVASAALLCGNGKTESVYYITPFLHF